MTTTKWEKVFFFVFLIFTILVVGVLNFQLHKLRTDFKFEMIRIENIINKEVTILNSEFDKTREERLLLEEQMIYNFKLLEKSLNQKTDSVKLDLETQLKDVSSRFEEKNIELNDKISSIKVQSSDFTSIIEDVVKAVVNIRTDKGSGSGVIVSKDGLIVTNKHVLENTNKLLIVDYDGKSYSAKGVLFAKDVDLALIQLDSSQSFSYLKFSAEEVKVGTKVIAVGNPLGLSFTVTEGIVSAVNRKADDSGIGYLQTDVSINPGSSGGPIINADKRIIGINTFKLSDSEGIGFAIPALIVEDFIENSS